MTALNQHRNDEERGIPPLIIGGARGGYEFYASDISAKALSVAKQNAKTHRVKIKFIHSDILENVRMSLDIIIANLPYLDPKWKDPSIKFEPENALFAKEGGLYLYRKLLGKIAARKQKPQAVYLEIDPRQKPSMTLLVKKHLPEASIAFHRDFAGRYRYAEIKLR